MSEGRKFQELEFELVLTGVLEDIYDLPVRSAREKLERSPGCAVLNFTYEYGAGDDDVKAVVSIVGEPDTSFSIRADFTDSWTVADSASPSEDLAWAIKEHLDACADRRSQAE